MRKVLPVLLALGVAACGPPPHWEKPGGNDESTAADMSACRQAAWQEANRYPLGYYPWGFGAPVWGMHRANYTFWQIRQDSDRFLAESRLTAFCMRTKGYELMAAPQQPQTQAPPPPASPEPPLPK